MSAGRPRCTRTQEGEEVSDALIDGEKPGDIGITDMQDAISNGYRRKDLFFTVRVRKCGSSGPFQQGIPQDFARYHPDLNWNDVTLENASGGKWVVLVRPFQNAVRFSKGWRAFSKGNNLRFGDQLVFTLIGKLHFKATVFDYRGKSLGQPPNAVEALPPTATAYDCRGKALAEPPHIKSEPSSPAAMPLQPLPVAVKPEYPLIQPAVHDSNVAKTILRQILPPPPSGQVPNSHITATPTEVPVPIPAPTVKGTRDVAPKEELIEMEVPEGKDYIFLDSDDDEVIVTQEKEEVSTPEIEECDDNYSVSESKDIEDSDDDSPLTRLPRSMNRRNYERGAHKKICMGQRSSEGEIMNRTMLPQAPYLASPIPTYKLHEVGESSQRQQHSVQVQEEDNDDGEAVRLIHLQGRKNFSDIVCTHRQHDFVSGQDIKHAYDTAMEFSSKLENHKFVAVMCAAQVYHGFYLPVPAAILEATGTQITKVVEAWLTDKNRKMYMVDWSWSEKWKTPMLNNNGWAKFALDHFLEEGDVCVFELVNSASASTLGLLFYVHIFRVEEAHRDSYRIPLASTFSAY